MLPRLYAELLVTNISKITFRVEEEAPHTEFKPIQASGGMLGPILYVIHKCDIPLQSAIIAVTSADDIVMLTIDEAIEEVTETLQNTSNNNSNICITKRRISTKHLVHITS